MSASSTDSTDAPFDEEEPSDISTDSLPENVEVQPCEPVQPEKSIVLRMKARERTDLANIAMELTTVCSCQVHGSVSCAHLFNINSVLHMRKVLVSFDDIGLLNWLLSYMKIIDDWEIDQFHYVAQGMSVCALGFRVFYGISKYKMERAESLVRHGIFSVQHGNHDRFYEDTLSAYCHAWFTRYCEVQGEHQPDKVEVHFPAKCFKYDIYQAFLISLQNLVDDVPSLSTFTHVWRTEFSHCIIPKCIRMGKCSVCEQYDIALTNAKNLTEKEQL